MIDFTDLIHKLNEYNNNILQENEKYKKHVEELKLQISDLEIFKLINYCFVCLNTLVNTLFSSIILKVIRN